MPKNEIMKEAQATLREVMMGANKEISTILTPILSQQEKREAFNKKTPEQFIQEAKRNPEKTIQEIIRHMPKEL